jgi:hypothetical protein
MRSAHPPDVTVPFCAIVRPALSVRQVATEVRAIGRRLRRDREVLAVATVHAQRAWQIRTRLEAAWRRGSRSLDAAAKLLAEQQRADGWAEARERDQTRVAQAEGRLAALLAELRAWGLDGRPVPEPRPCPTCASRGERRCPLHRQRGSVGRRWITL